jgi:hypothetical protein
MKRTLPDMKRLIPVIAVFTVLSLLAGSHVNAQSNPFVGTWKLNVEKSKYEPGPPPKESTRVWDASGKVDVQSIDASGKPRQYGYVVTLDGKASPTTGAVPSGADTAVFKQLDRNTIEVNFTKAGMHVETAKFALSKDGKSMTLTAKGVLPNGTAFNTVAPGKSSRGREGIHTA